MKRLGAVDYGRRRIGLAVADALGISVRGLPTVVRPRGEGLEEAARRVADLLRREGVEEVVLGLPLHEDGRESAASREVRRFGALLAAALAQPVVPFDEGLTTWEAEEDLKEQGRRLKEARRSGEVDRQAALRLLRSYLREQDRAPPEDPGVPPDIRGP